MRKMLNCSRTGTFVLSLILTVSLASAQIQNRRVVAYIGGPAPGTGGGTFWRFYLPVVMGSNGDIAFQAGYYGEGTYGIFVERAGQPLGSPYKGLDLSSALPDHRYLFFENPYLTASGFVAFTSTLNRVGEATQTKAVFLEGTEGLRLVIQKGATVNGTEFTDVHGLYASNDLGQTLFSASTSGAVTSSGSLWFKDGPLLDLIAESAAEALLNPQGLVAFKVGLPGQPGPGQEASVRVWTRSSREVTELARTRQPMPGLADNEIVNEFGPLMVNAAGRVAFWGMIKHNPCNFTSCIDKGYAIWMTGPDGSGLQVVFRQWTPGFPGTPPVPGPLISQSDVLTDQNRIASVSGARLSDGSSQAGIVLTSPFGAYTFVAKYGEPAPGIPGATFVSFGQVTANRNGQLAFAAQVTGAGITSSNNTGIWAQGADLKLQLVARTGETLEIAPGDTRTIHGLTYIYQGSGGSDGRFRQFSDGGDVVFFAELSPDGLVGSPAAIVATNVGAAVVEPKLIGLEAVQVVQDWNNTVPLVAGKKTIVRAHISNPTRITIRPILRGFAGTTELPGSPLAASNPGETLQVSRDAQVARGLLDESANFRLPSEWLTGSITLQVDVAEGDLQCDEAAGPQPDDCRVDVTFINTATPQLRVISLNYHDNGTLREVTPAQQKEVVDRMKELLPVAELDVDPPAQINWGDQRPRPNHDDANTFFLGLMIKQRAQDGCVTANGCKRIYYGISPSRMQGKADIAGSAAVGFYPADRYGEGRQVLSHEFSHTMGLHHAVGSPPAFRQSMFGGKTGACDEEGPATEPDFLHFYNIDGQLRPALGPMESGEDALVFGLDMDAMIVADPDFHFDLMSYCTGPKLDVWPSEYNYRRLITAITQRFGAQKPIHALAVDDYLLVRATVDRATNQVSFLPFGRLEDSAVDAVAPGPYTLRLLDGSETVLSEVPFELRLHSEGNTGSFLIPVTANPAIRRVEILHGGNVIGSLSASNTPPTVTVMTPNGGETINTDAPMITWTASDADGDNLTYDIQFSADGGATWRTLAVDWEAQSFEVSRTQLRQTTNGIVRVFASDGFHSGFDVSNAAFTVANNPPIAGISDPEHGSLFVGDQLITFEGFGSDSEDGSLAPGRLSWSSSLFGSLGSGTPNFKASALPEGEHVITLTATDAQGATSTDTSTIRILRSRPESLADLEPIHVGFQEAAAQGGIVAYQVKVENRGPDPAVDATFTFSAVQQRPGVADATAPIASVFGGAGWSCGTANNIVTCTRSQLPVAEGSIISIRVGPALMGTIRGRAEVSSTVMDPAAGNNVTVNETQVVSPVAGDINGDTELTIGDIFYLLNYLFASGAAPIGDGNVNGDSMVNSADVIYLISHLFAGGPGPQ